MSGLASRAVARIIYSTLCARTSFSKSGGLKQFKHARTPSTADSRRLTDLSFTASTRKGRIDGSCVLLMKVNMHARDRVTKTLLERVQRSRRVGKNRGRRGSTWDPKPTAKVDSRSIAAPESLLLSEHIALLMGRDRDRSAETRSTGKLHAPLPEIDVRQVMAFEIESHVSSVSVRLSTGRMESSSCCKVANESHGLQTLVSVVRYERFIVLTLTGTINTIRLNEALEKW